MKAKTQRIDDQVPEWERFFDDYFPNTLVDTALDWPDVRALHVSHAVLDQADPDLGELVLAQPDVSLQAAEVALRIMTRIHNEDARLRVRLVELPSWATLPLRGLRSAHLGRLVSVHGLIKQVTQVRPQVETAAWLCELCGARQRVRSDGPELVTPSVCSEASGGCGRRPDRWVHVRADSDWQDHQVLELQEPPEDLAHGEQPARIRLYATDDLVAQVNPGERVTVNLVLDAEEVRRQNRRQAEHERVGIIHSLERDPEHLDTIEITHEDEEQIHELARRPDVQDQLRASLAPEIHGLHIEKEALLLALFGGYAKPEAGGGRRRGDIHVLLVGDPGTAKSQLLRRTAAMAPRSVLTSGKGATSAGLTAAAVRDGLADGRWSLEAGALVIADGGLAIVDELDKMREEDRSALHEAMEQQCIHIAKAGINATLHTRCGVIAAANPKDGRWDPFTSPVEQIDLPPTLFSRFDLVLCVRDIPDAYQDAQLGRLILESNRAGELRAAMAGGRQGSYSSAQLELAARSAPPLSREQMRRYISYARRTVYPVLTDEALEHLNRYWTHVRSAAKDSVPITKRTLEALVRLTEASARSRLSPHGMLEDADRAVAITEHYLSRLGVDPSTGKRDVDLLETGVSASQRDRVRTLVQLVNDVSAARKDRTAPYGEIAPLWRDKGLTDDVLRRTLEQAKGAGHIWEIRHHAYRVV